MDTGKRLLRIKEVCQRVGLCRASVYNMVRRDEFPNPLQVGAQAVRWRSEDIEKWCETRPEVELSA